jgi:REP element-mobilizing transposase RayT
MRPINIRKSNVELDKLYFWTATINNWYKLLQEDALKEIIISSLKLLSVKKKIEVYAFVIMPNHLHFIWQLLEMNGKEKPHTSFLKFTAHSFKKHLQINNPQLLKLYFVNAANKEYEFWQRDSLPFELLNKETTNQKLDYIPVPTGQAGTTILMPNIGSYAKSQLIIITRP